MLKSEKKQIFLKKIFYKYCRNFSIFNNILLWRRRQDSWCITTVLYRWTLFLWKNNNNNYIKDPIKKSNFFPPFSVSLFLISALFILWICIQKKSNDCRCDMSMSFLFWNKEKKIDLGKKNNQTLPLFWIMHPTSTWLGALSKRDTYLIPCLDSLF